jgi:hypothetical protein
MSDNLINFSSIDDAYNSRDWNAYGALLDDGFRGWAQGSIGPHGKAAHLRQAKEFCAVSADNRVHNSDYIVRIADEQWTCTIARLTGSMTGPLKRSDGTMLEPSRQTFDTTFATIARWADGKIVEEYEFLDVGAILRQLGANV